MKNLVIASALVLVSLPWGGAVAQVRPPVPPGPSRFAQPSVSRTVEVVLPNGQPVTMTMTLSESGEVSFDQIANGTTMYHSSVNQAEIPEFQALLEKTLRWEQIATENKVERVEKVIGQLGKNDVVFSYSYPDAPARISWRGTSMWVIQVKLILQVLPQLGSAQEELAKVLAKAQKQDALFD